MFPSRVVVQCAIAARAIKRHDRPPFVCSWLRVRPFTDLYRGEAKILARFPCVAGCCRARANCTMLPDRAERALSDRCTYRGDRAATRFDSGYAVQYNPRAM